MAAAAGARKARTCFLHSQLRGPAAVGTKYGHFGIWGYPLYPQVRSHFGGMPAQVRWLGGAGLQRNARMEHVVLASQVNG